MAKNPKNPVLMGAYHKNSGKLCLEQVLGRFGTFFINKKKFPFFTEKTMIFRKKISKG